MHILMLLTVGFQEGWYKSLASVPPMISLKVFQIFLNRRFSKTFQNYLPGQDEIGSSLVHYADFRKQRLEKKYGHPALREALWTPMIRKENEHLLAEVYSQRMEMREAKGKYPERKKAVIVGTRIGGLTFDALNSVSNI
jgi:calcium permeable stress-gated cation channel